MNYIKEEVWMEYLAGSKELFQTIGLSFLDSYKNFSEELKKTIEDQNYTETYKIVHSLKGITLNIGMQDLYDICVVVLADLKQKGPDMEHIKSLDEIYQGTYKELKLLLLR